MFVKIKYKIDIFQFFENLNIKSGSLNILPYQKMLLII